MKNLPKNSNAHDVKYRTELLNLIKSLIENPSHEPSNYPYEQERFQRDFRFIVKFMGALNNAKSAKGYAELLLRVRPYDLSVEINVKLSQRNEPYLRSVFTANEIARLMLESNAFENTQILYKFLFDYPLFFVSYISDGYLSKDTNPKNEYLQKLIEYFKADSLVKDLGDIPNFLAGKLFVEIRNKLSLNNVTEYFFDKKNIGSGKWYEEYVKPNCINCFIFIHLIEENYFSRSIEKNGSHTEFLNFTTENIYLKNYNTASYFPIPIKNGWMEDSDWKARITHTYDSVTEKLETDQQIGYLVPRRDDKKKPDVVEMELSDKVVMPVIKNIYRARKDFINQFIESLD